MASKYLKKQRSSKIQTTNWWLTEVIKEMGEGGQKVKRKQKKKERSTGSSTMIPHVAGHG